MGHLHYNNIFLRQKSAGMENICFLNGINLHLHKLSNNCIISSYILSFLIVTKIFGYIFQNIYKLSQGLWVESWGRS